MSSFCQFQITPVLILAQFALLLMVLSATEALPVPIGPPGIQINTPTTVVLRQGHSITEDAIRQELDSDTLRLLAFAKPNRVLSHLGIRGSLGEVLNRRPLVERQELHSYIYPIDSNAQAAQVEPTKDIQEQNSHVNQEEVENSTELPLRTTELPMRTTPDKLLEELMTYGRGNKTAQEEEDSYKLGYSVDEGTLKRFRYEEKTPEGLIVGEFGIHKGNGDGIIRGVRYTAEAGVHPKVLYEALVKFLSL